MTRGLISKLNFLTLSRRRKEPSSLSLMMKTTMILKSRRSRQHPNKARVKRVKERVVTRSPNLVDIEVVKYLPQDKSLLEVVKGIETRFRRKRMSPNNALVLLASKLREKDQSIAVMPVVLNWQPIESTRFFPIEFLSGKEILLLLMKLIQSNWKRFAQNN